jgi:hypothetical protein
MASLIRRTKSNQTVTPGTGLGSVTPSPIVNRSTIPLAQIAGKDILSGANFTVAKGGGYGLTSIPTAILREDTSVFIPTQAQKNVITPQQVIGGQIVQVEKVSVTNAQEGSISVEYSTLKPKAQKTVSAPIVKTVSNPSQASAISKILGRTVQSGQGLTKADVARINTPRASTGFSGGMGFGQAFPVNQQAFQLAQAAVDRTRAFGLALKAGYSVSLPGGGQQSRSISFKKLN